MYEVQWEGYEKGKSVKKKHGKFKTLKEAQDSVIKWWNLNNFEPPYVREIVYADGNIWWDYGSHVCFYHFVRVDES